jgi:purine nucleoside phosphorylase
MRIGDQLAADGSVSEKEKRGALVAPEDFTSFQKKGPFLAVSGIRLFCGEGRRAAFRGVFWGLAGG